MRIDLKAIVEQSGIDFNSFALALFPHNKHPNMALRRSMDKRIQLNESQIYTLSKMLCVEVKELYDESWKLKAKGNSFIFTKNGYTAVLDREKSCTVICGFGRECEFVHTFEAITLDSYISLIESIIQTHFKQ